MDYRVPANVATAEYDIKKSRFIGYVNRAHSRSDAMGFLDEIKNRYPDARHHCWAYLLGKPSRPESAAFSDDGEPSGTAGKPILNVLQHKGVGEVMLIVVRYFGGIKLGAGGLVRAYSAAAQLAMENLVTEMKVTLLKKTVCGDYPLEQSLRHWLAQHQGNVLRVDYQEEVIMDIEVRPQDEQALLGFVAAHLGSVKKHVD